ncbi:MAG: hypothetical protein R3F42_09380 [Pseudomonadota bacterium]
MATEHGGIIEQLRRNAVALVSLAVALSSLGYNTWRNEQTEANRNQRQAAFEVLLKLGELQRLVFHSHYDRDAEQGNPRTGWAYILTVRDLAQVIGTPMTGMADELLATWSAHWQDLGNDESGAEVIISGIDRARESTLQVLRALD